MSYWIDVDGKRISEKDLKFILGNVLLPMFCHSLSDNSKYSLFLCYQSVFHSTLFFSYMDEKDCSESLKSGLVQSALNLLSLFNINSSIPLQNLYLHLLTFLMQRSLPCIIESAFPARCLHNALQLLPILPDDPKYVTNVLQLIRVCHSNSSFSIDNISDFQFILSWVTVHQRPLSVANEALSTIRVILKHFASPKLKDILYHYLLWSYTLLSQISHSISYEQLTHSIEVIRVLFYFSKSFTRQFRVVSNHFQLNWMNHSPNSLSHSLLCSFQ